MKFDQDTIRKVADLARLELSATEVEKYTGQVASILGYVEKLNELDTTNVEPLTHPLDLTTPLREDRVAKPLGDESVLASAPDALYDSYKVPQVLGGAT